MAKNQTAETTPVVGVTKEQAPLPVLTASVEYDATGWRVAMVAAPSLRELTGFDSFAESITVECSRDGEFDVLWIPPAGARFSVEEMDTLAKRIRSLYRTRKVATDESESDFGFGVAAVAAPVTSSATPAELACKVVARLMSQDKGIGLAPDSFDRKFTWVEANGKRRDMTLASDAENLGRLLTQLGAHIATLPVPVEESKSEESSGDPTPAQNVA